MDFKIYVKNKLMSLSYKDLIIFLVPFMIFMGYLYIFNPGILRYDSFYQLHQIATSQYNDWHPFFHTFIEMLCLKIYPNTKSVAILQIITFSVIWTLMCNYFRKSIEDDKKIFIFQAIFTVIISLIPINAIYSITLLKDTLFCYFLVFNCFLIKVLLDKKDNVDYGVIVLISLVMAFVVQLRYNGIYIIIPIMIILAIHLYKTNNAKKLYIIMPALTIIFILMIASLNIAYDVEENQKDALGTKIAHMLADYDLNLNITSSDHEKILKLFNETKMKENYELTFSDPIYRIYNKTEYNQDKESYILLAADYSMKNPKHFLEYLFGSSVMVWDIVRSDDWSSQPYYTDIEYSRVLFFSNHSKNIPVKGFEQQPAKNKGKPIFESLNSTVNYIINDKVLDTLFDSPALYMYLSLILIGAIIFIDKSKDMILIYLPNLINIIVIFLSVPTQDNRYLYPNILLFYLIILMLITIIFKRKNNNLKN